MKLYIIRHGETRWNTLGKLQGQTDIELNEKGCALAVRTGRGMRDIPFDLAITSPLRRARRTAELVLEDRDIPILEDARIAEISFGKLEGRAVKKENGVYCDPDFSDFFHAPERYQAPAGAETIEELLARTGAFLEELRTNEEWRDRTILISTHGAASRALLANIRRSEIKDFWAGGVPKNCAVSIAELVLRPAAISGGAGTSASSASDPAAGQAEPARSMEHASSGNTTPEHSVPEWILKEQDIIYYDNENIGF